MPPSADIIARATAPSGGQHRARDWRRFTIIPRLETFPAAIAFARTTSGRLVLVAIFTLLLRPLIPSAGAAGEFGLEMLGALWLHTGLVLGLISLFPRHRPHLVALASVVWILHAPPLSLDLLQSLVQRHHAAGFALPWPIVVIGVFLGAWGYVRFVRRFPSSLPGRRPTAGLLVILCVLLIAARALPLSGAAFFVITAAAMIFGKYVWFIAYAASAPAARQAIPFWKQLGAFRPFWQSWLATNVPFAKGSAYLDRVEAKDPSQFAIAQLKGLKLIAWALLLAGVAYLLDCLVLPSRHWLLGAWAGAIPTYSDALNHQVSGHPPPLHMRWLALVLEFLRNIAQLSVLGHTIIAICRMAGYNAARNTYRPFTSTTIAEFYNRVYFYFKELLVDFFFYPTYFRWFKRHPRLRLFTATVAAAGLGNFLYHFLRDDSYILELGFWRAFQSFQVYAAYALILGTAIGISQFRAAARGPRKVMGFRKVPAIAVVLTFYCLMTILDGASGEHSKSLGQCGAYFLSLFRR